MCRGFFFQAEDGIRDYKVTGVQTCALPICAVFLRDTTGAGPAVAAIGYFAFSGAMASGRLAGDGLVLGVGARRSEERRVGEEGRSRGLPDPLKKKKRRRGWWPPTLGSRAVT